MEAGFDGEIEPDIPTEEIFQAALSDFRTAVGDTQWNAFTNKTLRDVKIKVIGIQYHQERLKGLMNFARIKFYLERFAEFDNICRATRIGGENRSEELSSSIWGPSDYILQRAQEDPNVLNAVLDAYQRFGLRIPDLEQYQDLIQSQPKMITCVGFMYRDLTKFYGKIIELLTNRSWKKTFHVDWKDYDQVFNTLLESFDANGKYLKDLLDAWKSREDQDRAEQAADSRDQRANDHYLHFNEFYENFKQLMRNYSRDRAETLRKAEDAEERRKQAQRESVVAWLRSEGVKQSAYHDEFRKAHKDFPETGDWILKNEKLINWIHEGTPNPVMWLNGKKGAGKTVVASAIIDRCKQIPDFKTSYFYCREGDPSQNSCMAVLKELLRQLVLHNQAPLPSCIAKKNNSGEEVLTNVDTMKSLLELFCDSNMNQFVVIDGLDECNFPEVKPIVKFWMSMVERCENYKPGKIRVLFVSQDNGEIRKLMASAEIFDLTPEQSGADIAIYIRSQFRKLQQQFGLSDKEVEEKRQIFLNRAEGMFLYATLVIPPLFKQPNTGMLRTELESENIPSGLGAAYEKIINGLEQNLIPNQWKMAKKIFSLLAGAKRPLKWHELQGALSIETPSLGEVYVDYENNKLRNDVRETCGSLVQVLQQNRVEFIHSTTRQYILQNKHLDERTVECDLTIMSLKYLTMDCFRHDLNDEDITHSIRSGSYAFQDYAISKWKYHLQSLITRETMPSLFLGPQASADYEWKMADALTRFVAFHKESIIEAAKEKPPPGRSQQREARSHPSSQASRTALQPHSPTSTQLSSSPSPGPSSQQSQPKSTGPDPEEACKAFRDTRFYTQLVEIWTHVLKHQQGDYKERHKVSLPHLGTALEKIRGKIEELVSSSEKERDKTNITKLTEFYGDRHFKCQRVGCDYFHEGFDTKPELENHSNRHDRPFHCPVEGCSMVPFGFSTNKDKDRHIRMYHPGESGQPARFVHGQEGRTTTTDAKWECDICHKKFTRHSIKKDHVDAHYGERRHGCETCGKRFTRSSDRNRHRKIHVRRVRG